MVIGLGSVCVLGADDGGGASGRGTDDGDTGLISVSIKLMKKTAIKCVLKSDQICSN